MGKKRRKRRKKFPYFLAILVVILVGLASWSLYAILHLATKDLLKYFNIESLYLQSGIIILAVFALLLLLGTGLKKSIEKMIK